MINYGNIVFTTADLRKKLIAWQSTHLEKDTLALVEYLISLQVGTEFKIHYTSPSYGNGISSFRKDNIDSWTMGGGYLPQGIGYTSQEVIKYIIQYILLNCKIVRISKGREKTRGVHRM